MSGLLGRVHARGKLRVIAHHATASPVAVLHLRAKLTEIQDASTTRRRSSIKIFKTNLFTKVDFGRSHRHHAWPLADCKVGFQRGEIDPPCHQRENPGARQASVIKRMGGRLGPPSVSPKWQWGRFQVWLCPPGPPQWSLLSGDPGRGLLSKLMPGPRQVPPPFPLSLANAQLPASKSILNSTQTTIDDPLAV